MHPKLESRKYLVNAELTSELEIEAM
jgi:hypothetical protein